MKELQVDFQIRYEVNKGNIKATPSGSRNGITWNPSVSILSTNIIEMDVNEKTNFANTIEQQLVFKIECPDDITCGLVASFIKNKFFSNESIYLDGLLPVSYDSGVTQVKVLNPLSYFLSKSTKDKEK